MSRFFRRRLAVAALAVIVLIFAAGALASVIAPYSYSRFNVEALTLSPTLRGHHFFGTDQVGHDNLSLTLYGIRTSVEVAFSVAIGATLIGIVIGAIAGYYGRWADALLMRIVDFIGAIPVLAAIFAALLYVGVTTPQRMATVLILCLWTSLARVVRAGFLSLRETEFVVAARAAGASPLRIIARHLLPNISGSMIVAATGLVGQAILLEATIEFFGYGLNQWATPSLGTLVADGSNNGLFTYWWLYVFPAGVIVAMLVCVNFVGDSLDEALNPIDVRGRVT